MKAGGRIWSITWRLLVCALLLAWIFHAIFLKEGELTLTRQGIDWDDLSRAERWQVSWHHGPRELWRTLTLISPAALFYSLVLMGLTIFLGVLRWRMVLHVQGLNLPFTRAVEISLVAHFFNSFLLGSTGGDLLKAYYAARETHHKKTEAVVTVLADRLIGLFSMLVFACLMILPNGSLFLTYRRYEFLAGIILCMMLACGAVVALSFWGGVSRGWTNARLWLRKLPKGDLVEKSLNACRQFGNDRSFLPRTMLISMALNVACVLQVLVLSRGLGLRVSILALFAIVPIVICFSAIPITPSGLGVRENLYVYMLTVPAFGVLATQALSLSLLAYAGSLFWSVVGGIVYVCLKESQHLAEVTKPATVADTV